MYIDVTHENLRSETLAVRRAALFGKDFTRHLAAVDMLLSALTEDFDALLAALDLVFRWVVLRLCEGNMQALVKVCELTNALLNALYENVSHAQQLFPSCT